MRFDSHELNASLLSVVFFLVCLHYVGVAERAKALLIYELLVIVVIAMSCNLKIDTFTAVDAPVASEVHLMPCKIDYNGEARVRQYFYPVVTQKDADCSDGKKRKYRYKLQRQCQFFYRGTPYLVTEGRREDQCFARLLPGSRLLIYLLVIWASV